MGVSIHYSLRLPTRSIAKAERTVRTLREASLQLARERGLGAVTPVFPLAESVMYGTQFVVVQEGEYSRGIEVEPIAGWCFAVTVGRDCEPATFGLGRYPSTVEDGDHRRRTGLGGVWRFRGACKTQYASMHGRDHLLNCHRAVLDLALLWRDAGAEVEIVDEGELHTTQDPDELFRRTDFVNRVTAGLAGALKDDAEERGEPPIKSPIFEHPLFEHLEAEAGPEIAEALAAIRAAMRRPESEEAEG